MTQAYPLQWPNGRPRTELWKREASRFDSTPDIARRMMLAECDRMGGRNPIISTNVALRRDGQPYASRKPPEDTGVALYFTRKAEQVCFSCDRYLEVWENMRAIQKTIEAMRGIERWGAHEVLDQMFRGFTALPSPEAATTAPPRAWWSILGVAPDAGPDAIQAAWKKAIRTATDAERLDINLARDAGLAANGR
jgi:hypothetical protein